MELLFDLDATYTFFESPEKDEISPLQISIKATYLSGQSTMTKRIHIDLRMFAGASAAAVGSLAELKELNKNLEKLTSTI